MPVLAVLVVLNHGRVRNQKQNRMTKYLQDVEQRSVKCLEFLNPPCIYTRSNFSAHAARVAQAVFSTVVGCSTEINDTSIRTPIMCMS